ncbi:Hyaluronan/mRNA-binding protein [Actinidia chinensis var. chinensis]|uniref:Hyaluronan/mRNA-binding protein n=1 Tax=Actinidia chinensis var. chinensis TaxID=1590841 RepID=A0A2R6PM98_ACTCC|nr:Hyaluronan/mRNA-binding protein [Actinidia chinensis var. chinensis]
MATTNPFDLLGDDDNDDPSQLIAAQQKLLPPPKKTPAPAAAAAKTAKLPSKPLPPAQAVREAKDEAVRGGGRGGGRGFGRGRGGGRFNRETANTENTFSTNNGFSGEYKPSEEGEGGKPSERRGGYVERRGGFRGGRRGGFNNGEVAEGEYQRRTYERRSGTGHGNEIKRDGAGRGNWGTPIDEIAPETEEPINEAEKTVDAEKQLGQEDSGDANKENPANEPEEKEPEEKEMTLEEYEKVLEEKRKALQALKAEERKVVADKDFESMQLLSNKKSDDDVFLKLGSDKDKRKDAADKEEKVKKAVSINEFLKPEGDRYYSPGGRGRGRGRGPRGGFSDGPRGYRGSNMSMAPPIDDVGQFPTLGVK